MINNIARLASVLFLAASVASADPITVDGSGWACGLESEGPDNAFLSSVVRKGSVGRRGLDFLSPVTAWWESRFGDWSAWTHPFLPGPDPAPGLIDLGGMDQLPLEELGPLVGETLAFPSLPSGPVDPPHPIDMTPNPEPGSLLLAGAGLMALYLLRRRRQQG